MAVKRTKDPLGLLPDYIDFSWNGDMQPDDFIELQEWFNSLNIVARILRLKRHNQLIPTADELHALALQKGAGTRDIECDWELRARVAEAEFAALYFDAEYLPARERKAVAKAGGDAKVANNTKAKAIAAAKAEAFALWQAREAGKHPNLRTEEQFAIECCSRWDALPSISTVMKWSTQWRKEANAKRDRK